MFADHHCRRFGCRLPVDVPHVIGGVITANPVEIIARTARMTLNLPGEHRKRVIEIVERLWFGIHKNFARGVYATPFFEEASRKLSRNTKTGDRITAANR